MPIRAAYLRPRVRVAVYLVRILQRVRAAMCRVRVLAVVVHRLSHLAAGLAVILHLLRAAVDRHRVRVV